MPGPRASLTVEIDERTKTLEGTANDRDHQRKAQRACAHEGLRRAADPDPQWQSR
jgi:hypothetical protein